MEEERKVSPPQENYVPVNILVKEADLVRLKGSMPGRRPGQRVPNEDAVQHGIIEYLANLNSVLVSNDTLRDIASRAGINKIRSERDLLRAFEQFTKVDEHAAVVRLDPNSAGQIYEMARSNKLTLGEQLTELFHHAIANAWFDEWVAVRYLFFTDGEWKRLKESVSPEKPLASGGQIVQWVIRALAALEHQRAKIEELEGDSLERAYADVAKGKEQVNPEEATQLEAGLEDQAKPDGQGSKIPETPIF